MCTEWLNLSQIPLDDAALLHPSVPFAAVPGAASEGNFRVAVEARRNPEIPSTASIKFPVEVNGSISREEVAGIER